MLAHPPSQGNYATRDEKEEEEWKPRKRGLITGRSLLPNSMHRLMLPILVASIPALSSRISAADSMHDLVIFGATPAGIVAGVAAAREGASVLLLEPTPWIGGMVTGGLTRTDKGNESTIGGLTREFFELASERYEGKVQWYAEPKANLDVCNRWVREFGLDVRVSRHLASVQKDGNRIVSVTTSEGETHRGSQFIDASYEGDLMALAKVSYLVGRESRDQYGEPLAGYHPMPIRERSPEVMGSDAYLRNEGGPSYVHGTPAPIRARGDDGELLPGVLPAPDLQPGDADGATQSYNFRLVVTQREDLKVPFPKPDHYDPDNYELLLRLIRSFPEVPFGRLVHLGEVANGKYDLNAQGFFSTDVPGLSFDYPDGDTSTRARIYREHRDFIQGMLWFLGHDERVPTALREDVNSWGLCRDEFTDNDHWPYALYVREGRRMIGDYVMTQADCQSRIFKPDSVGMGSFVLDCHIVRRIETPDGHVVDEGSFADAPTRPYQIPYRSITPQSSECANLLVPVCLSASHIACCSLRMEPVYMALGQASGLAAVQAMRNGHSVQQIDVAKLQSRLLEQKAVLGLDHGDMILSSELEGVVVDDLEAEYVGEWKSSPYGKPVDGFSRHDNNSDKGRLIATFRAALPRAGRYEVRFAYAQAPNRAKTVPVTIMHASGETRVTVDETQKPTHDGAFVSLGEFEFAEGRPATVLITNENTDNYVSVDAVQFLAK